MSLSRILPTTLPAELVRDYFECFLLGLTHFAREGKKEISAESLVKGHSTSLQLQIICFGLQSLLAYLNSLIFSFYNWKSRASSPSLSHLFLSFSTEIPSTLPSAFETPPTLHSSRYMLLPFTIHVKSSLHSLPKLLFFKWISQLP